MKKNITYLLLFFMLSCSNEKGDQIELFNGNIFTLAPNETEAELSEEVKLNYNTPDVINNIPLFKSIDGVGYKIYLGIPIETSIKKYYTFKKETLDSDSNLVKTESSCYNYLKVDSTYYVEMLLKKEKSLFFVKGQTKKQEILNTVLSKDEIINRFITK